MEWEVEKTQKRALFRHGTGLDAVEAFGLRARGGDGLRAVVGPHRRAAGAIEECARILPRLREVVRPLHGVAAREQRGESEAHGAGGGPRDAHADASLRDICGGAEKELREVAHTVAIEIAAGSVRAGGVVRVQGVLDFPPIGQSVAVGVLRIRRTDLQAEIEARGSAAIALHLLGLREVAHIQRVESDATIAIYGDRIQEARRSAGAEENGGASGGIRDALARAVARGGGDDVGEMRLPIQQQVREIWRSAKAHVEPRGAAERVVATEHGGARAEGDRFLHDAIAAHKTPRGAGASGDIGGDIKVVHILRGASGGGRCGLQKLISKAAHAIGVHDAGGDVRVAFALVGEACVAEGIADELGDAAVLDVARPTARHAPADGLENREDAVVVEEVFRLAIEIHIRRLGDRRGVSAGKAGPRFHALVDGRIAHLRLRDFCEVGEVLVRRIRVNVSARAELREVVARLIVEGGLEDRGERRAAC